MDGLYQGNYFYMLLRLYVQRKAADHSFLLGAPFLHVSCFSRAQMTRALVRHRIQVTERASLLSLPIRTLILSAQRLTLWPHLASLEVHLQIHSGVKVSRTQWVEEGARTSGLPSVPHPGLLPLGGCLWILWPLCFLNLRSPMRNLSLMCPPQRGRVPVGGNSPTVGRTDTYKDGRRGC